MKRTYSMTILDECSGKGTNFTALVDQARAETHRSNIPEPVYMKLTSAFNLVLRRFLDESFTQAEEQ